MGSQKMSEIAAFLYDHETDHLRHVCVGCSQLLYFAGYLTKVREIPLTSDGGVAVCYTLADCWTVQDCADFVRGRHVGGDWPE